MNVRMYTMTYRSTYKKTVRNEANMYVYKYVCMYVCMYTMTYRSYCQRKDTKCSESLSSGPMDSTADSTTCCHRLLTATDPLQHTYIHTMIQRLYMHTYIHTCVSYRFVFAACCKARRSEAQIQSRSAHTW